MLGIFKVPATVVVVASLLGGCSGSQEIFRPFDIDQTSVSADAKQRVIISALRGPEGQTRRIVCAEPSPDATAATAASLGTDLAAKVPLPQAGGTVSPEANLALQYAIAEQVAYVGVRNSTIQLLRDGLYRACEAYMNGAIGDFGYSLILANYGRLMVALLSAEGLTRPQFTGATILNSQANTTGQGGKDTSKTVNATAQGSGTAGTAQGGGDRASAADQAAMITLVHDLADPHSDVGKSVIDITMACFMWSEETPMRSPKNLSPQIQKFCEDVFSGIPEQMDKIMNASLQRYRNEPAQAPNQIRPGIQAALPSK
jgi:hypothetical protein